MKRLEKNQLEWAVFAVSLALVLGLIGFLGYRAFKDHGKPPDITITLGPVEQRRDRYYVPVILKNDGDRTAESVRIVVRLGSPAGEPVEEAELEVPFLPHHSERHGQVTFSRQPSEAERLTARVVGYSLP